MLSCILVLISRMVRVEERGLLAFCALRQVLHVEVGNNNISDLRALHHSQPAEGRRKLG